MTAAVKVTPFQTVENDSTVWKHGDSRALGIGVKLVDQKKDYILPY
jgi:hypothetical protein